MTCHVHAFDARVGGKFQVSLTYDAPTGVGKTTAHTDTYHGRFVELVPNNGSWKSMNLRRKTLHFVAKCRSRSNLPIKTVAPR